MTDYPTLLLEPDSQGIVCSPLNLSKSKMHYSFPKSERFAGRFMKSPCKAAFYDTPNDMYKSSRSTALGYGNKYDFTKTVDKVPAPNKYDIKRDLDQNSKTFGMGREKVALNGIIPKKMYRGEAPGPGNYPIGDMKSPIKYSFRKKLPATVTSNMTSPGAGKYSIPETLNSTGNYFQSKYASSKSQKYGSEKRFKDFSTNLKNPAPGNILYIIWIGTYKAVDQINLTGAYNLSKYKNSMCRSFSKADRNTLGIDITKKSAQPGPGNYRAPSEFGYYISSQAKLDSAKSMPSLK